MIARLSRGVYRHPVAECSPVGVAETVYAGRGVHADYMMIVW